MKIQFVKPDLHQIDRVNVDTLVLCLFEEEKPPRGLTGLIDWRLCGRISELIVKGRMTGRFRESFLFPSYGRLPVTRICTYGLGPIAEFTPARARETSWFMADSLRKLRVPSFAGALPGSPLSTVPARARMELFLEELVRVFGADDSTAIDACVVEPLDLHRELTETVSVSMRKLRVIWK